jgi:hypothetical protein
MGGFVRFETIKKERDGALPYLLEDTADENMKFSNSDISLKEVVDKNGGHFVLSNTDILTDTSW